LVEGQERNTAQLKRIRTAMEQRWSLEGEVRKKESVEIMQRGPRMAPEKVRRSRLHHPSSVSIVVLFLLNRIFYFL